MTTYLTVEVLINHYLDIPDRHLLKTLIQKMFQNTLKEGDVTDALVTIMERVKELTLIDQRKLYLDLEDQIRRANYQPYTRSRVGFGNI